MSKHLKDFTELNKYFRMKEIFDYLDILRDSGIVNMFGAYPYLILGRERVEHEFKYKYKHNEEKFNELLELADSVRDNLIAGSYKQVSEKMDADDDKFLRSIKNKMKRNAEDIVKIWVNLKGTRMIREEEENPKMSDLPSFFQRRFDGVKFDKKIRQSIDYAFRVTNNVDEFIEVILEVAVSTYLWEYYNIDVDNWDNAEFTKVTGPLKEVYGALLKSMYYKHRKSNANR